MNFQKRKKYKNVIIERYVKPRVWMVNHANTSHRQDLNSAKDI